MPTSATAAAVSSPMPGGVGYSQFSNTQAYSANVPCRPNNPWFDPQTRSPTFRLLTLGPTVVTVPARSQPGMNGFGNGMATAPARMYVSMGLSAAAVTRTRTSLSFGVGVGTSP